MPHLSRREERRGWRRIYLWAVPVGLILGVLLSVGAYLGNRYFPPSTGQDEIATLERIDGLQPPQTIGNATIEIKKIERYGDVLTDGFGRSLYLFEDDVQGQGSRAAVSKCYDECANSWPPLRAEAAPTATQGIDPDLLGTTRRKDGTVQVTYNGWPLYRFVRDFGPQSGTGHDLKDFSAEWYLVSPTGEPVDTSPAREAGRS